MLKAIELRKMNRCVAMYDIRGIQEYIYKNPKIKDVIGASGLVENIIENALTAAIKANPISESESCLLWKNEKAPLPFKDDAKKIQVLFIGGGNAYVLYESGELCYKINKAMSKYIMENTYSLQLAVSVCEKTEDYAADMSNLRNGMETVKAEMKVSKTVGAMPVMQIEIKTGLPAVEDNMSTEARLKKQYKEHHKSESNEEKSLDKISKMAVVHLDGNNMGLRIRNLMESTDSYEDAVNRMRAISFSISNSYEKVFKEMKTEMLSERNEGDKSNRIEGDEPTVIREIVVAGDDITYVCNADIAIKSVEYYCKKISGYTMNMFLKNDSTCSVPSEQDIEEYGFSVCCGIAFVGSHFPFSIAYDVAENCCDEAKDRGKRYAKEIHEKTNSYNENRCGNFIDFQVCKDISCRDLYMTRSREYYTPDGDSLLLRPYYIETEYDPKEMKDMLSDKPFAFKYLVEYIRFFNDADTMPRSLSKKLRNHYCLGKNMVDVDAAFLYSRNWKLPDNAGNATEATRTAFWIKGLNDDHMTARYFDALELMDV
jgi:hypothetical protein